MDTRSTGSEPAHGGRNAAANGSPANGPAERESAAGAPAAGGPSRPVPDEALDALVTILDEIRLGRSTSRSELALRTGLSRAVVAQRVGELIDRDLVTERGRGVSTGGRPPRRLAFRADAGHVLVADLGATGIDVAVTSLDGRVLGHIDEPADIAAGPDMILDRVEALFDQLLGGVRGLPGHTWGVGIGVPGPVEFRTGRPISPPIMPGWDGFPVRERFAGRYRAPVWVDNDVNVLALGEWRAGIAIGHDDVVVIKVGTGIGAGIIAGGRLHRGARGAAGDVGHVQVVDDPSIVCRCGNIGCLEALAGGAAIARDGEAAARDGRSERLRSVLDERGRVTAADVAWAAGFGDPLAVALIQQAGRRVGAMLAAAVNMFNPSLIVVAGGVARSGDLLLAAIRETVYRRSLPLATRDLQVRASSLGSLAGVIGASSMVLDQLFARETLARWAGAGTPAGLPDVVHAIGR